MFRTRSCQDHRPTTSATENLTLMLCITIAFVGLFALSTSAQDGSSDPTFNPTDQGYGFGDGVDGEVLTSALQPDGRVIIGGAFTAVHGVVRGHIARLNTDGTLDNSFVNANGNATGTVQAMALQADGKIVIGGTFPSYQGNSLPSLARINSDGTLDAGFNMGTGLVGVVAAIKVQGDGKILVAGSFTAYNGTARRNIMRLLTTGAIDATFDPGLGSDFNITALAVQTDGKILAGGTFTTWNGAAHRSLVRLHSDGTLEAAYSSAAGTLGDVNCLALQSDGKVVLGGNFTVWGGTTRNRIARLTTTGALDPTFDPGNGPSLPVRTVVVLGTGKVLVGGDFGNYNGTNRQNIARVNSNGTLDATFDPGSGAYTRISTIAVQADNKLVLGGSFPRYNGIGRRNIARVSADGALDAAYATNTGANDVLYDCTLQPDGKILIAGDFTLVNGVGRNRIARLNADGSVDPTFAPASGADNVVYAIALQPDGKILIAGSFGAVNGTVRNRVARLNANGSLDATFNPGTGANHDVYAAMVQPDGKVLLGGGFTQFNGAAINRIVRLTATGAVDNTFSTGTGLDSYVHDFALQPDGKILVGGSFTTCNGTPRSSLARLNVNGSLDASFNVGFDNAVRCLAFQADGKLLVGGVFTLVNGYTRQRCVRLDPDGSVDPGFDAGAVSSTVLSVAPLADGRIMFGGVFSVFGGHSYAGLVRTGVNGAVDPGFSPSGPGNITYAIVQQPDGKLLLAGQFTRIGATGRNRIARLDSYAGVNLKVILEGPYTGTNMSDVLRTLPGFPLTEPFTAMGYSGITSYGINPATLTATGNNAIVDWVVVEVRPVAQPAFEIVQRPALLQRDGDVVAMDGVSPISFQGLVPGDYLIAVRSRNHLPVMQAIAAPLSYGPAAATVNFTLPGTQVYAPVARKNIGGVMVLVAGDVNFDGAVKYTGSNNDRDPVLVRVGGAVPNNTANGYYAEDVNMDGIVKYTGQNNDRDPILVTVGGSVPTNTVNAQLP